MIGYCTNVRAGDDVSAVRSAMDAFVRPLRTALGDRMLPLGLWLTARSAEALGRSGAIETLRDELAEAGVAVASINAFPYGDFHQPIVKHCVYAPDWSLPQRAAYTRNCCLLLRALLPEGGHGGVSTLPIAWREGFGLAGIERAAAALRSIVPLLHELAERDGRTIHIDLEPEPGCVLDRPEDVIAFFNDHLLRGASAQEEDQLRRHVRVCHDVCHASVMFIEQESAINAYAAAGIRIGRVQISNAPSVDLMCDRAAGIAKLQALSAFAEPRWLHQTYMRSPDADVTYLGDLPGAIEHLQGSDHRDCEVRTHFHVPVHLASLGAIESTHEDVVRAIRLFARHPDDPVFEVETYAWSVLPPSLRGESLVHSAAAELRFCREVLRAADEQGGGGDHVGG